MSEVASRLSKHKPATRVLFSIAAIATLCIIKFDINLGVRDTIGIDLGETEDFYHNQQQQRRNTLSFEPRVFDKLHSDWNYQGDESEEDYNAAVALANDEEEGALPLLPPLPKYTIKDALDEASVWEWTFCVLVYDPSTDKFIVHYSKQHSWRSSMGKLQGSLNSFTYMLRETFPERFTKDSDELVLPISAGDYPHVNIDELPHNNGIAPLLMFGSSFRDPTIYTNMIPMPLPTHMSCFKQWAESDKSYVGICGMLKSKKKNQSNSLVFGDEYGLGDFDSLIPQVVWRGTDFQYLPSLKPGLSRPNSELVHKEEDKELTERRQNVVASLKSNFDKALPRWKGIILTAEAEIQAEKTNDMPWVNMRFSSYAGGGKPKTIGSEKFAAWESVSIATGESMKPQELAKYKYHIDMGGGGGTTWSGTIEKLAMPGALFHHVTPMKDYIHDHLKAWKHYIPVSADLKDLKQKFDWAQAHPQEAKKIADAATEFMKELGTPQGFEKLYEQDFVEPLRRVIEAYQPVSIAQFQTSQADRLHSPDKAFKLNSKSWRNVLEALDTDFLPVMECPGTASRNQCLWKLSQQEIKAW